MYDTASRLVRCGPISLHLTHTGSLPSTSLGGALEVRSGGVGAAPPLKSSAPFCLGTPRRPGPTYGGACCTGCEATECGLHRCRSRTGSASPARDRSRFYPSIYLSIYLSIYPSIHPSIYHLTSQPSNFQQQSVHPTTSIFLSITCSYCSCLKILPVALFLTFEIHIVTFR